MLRAAIASLIAALALCSVSVARDAKPWEKSGTKAGEEIVGPDGGTMVWVPAGQFTMGSAPGEGYANEHPAHRVIITKGFWLGKCPVTNAQYRRFCRATGAQFPQDSDQGGSFPVGSLSGDEAVKYCAHYGLSLPTEAQWEYAARGPESRVYPWGNEWNPMKCCNAENKGPDGRGFPVGSFPAGASWCGALDLAGGGIQWCQDWFSDGYYAHSLAADPPGPEPGVERVARGSDWDSDASMCRCALRWACGPESVGEARCLRIP